MKFFTADLHLFQNKRARENYDLPSFAALWRKLVPRWNRKVPSNADVFILGDLSKKRNININDILYLLDQLNGRKFLVPSLSDPVAAIGFNSRLTVLDSIVMLDDGPGLVLCHYPLFRWEKSGKGVVCLHGHLHGHYTDAEYLSIYNTFDVGLPGSPDFTPYSLDEALYGAR